jgi:parvulin-like peptidyl-prolyl isomerase
MKTFKALALLGVALLTGGVARAQEGELKVVDEVVARVNSDFIMLSAYKRAQQDLLEDLKQRGLSGAELEKQFNETKAVILDMMIDQQLLVQRAKDLSIDVEPQINEQLLRVMNENKFKSLEELAEKMREAGIDIDEVRRNLRMRFLTDFVKNREVYGKIYRELTEKEKREFYEKHKQFFAVPGEVTLSRIFIAFGKEPEQALARAREVATQARSGAADFAALAQRHSEEELGKKGGVVGTIKIPDLSNEVRAAIEQAKAGTVTDPIKLDTGYAIFRIDQRKEPVTKPFEEREVQDEVGQRLTYERGNAQMEAYLEKLRNEAFIEIAPKYQLAASKIKSGQIKRTPYSEEKKDKKKDDKKKEDAKATAAAKPSS